MWDYPRPPRVEAVRTQVEVIFAGNTIALTLEPLRVLETSHPPVYYLPPEDVRMDLLRPSATRSFCAYKGQASYWSLEVAGAEHEDVVWSYEEPLREAAEISGLVAFFNEKVDIVVDAERLERPHTYWS